MMAVAPQIDVCSAFDASRKQSRRGLLPFLLRWANCPTIQEVPRILAEPVSQAICSKARWVLSLVSRLPYLATVGRNFKLKMKENQNGNRRQHARVDPRGTETACEPF